jgi:hypothetical protein
VVVTAVIMFVCVIAGLNIWSTVEILRDDGSSRVQKMAQISFVWLVPILACPLSGATERNAERGNLPQETCPY